MSETIVNDGGTPSEIESWNETNRSIGFWGAGGPLIFLNRKHVISCYRDLKSENAFCVGILITTKNKRLK